MCIVTPLTIQKSTGLIIIITVNVTLVALYDIARVKHR
jgi:hypothetical protein